MQQVGVISRKVAEALGIEDQIGKAILMGESNIAHMKQSHPDDYEKYGSEIRSILSAPDYVGLNPKDGSLEYVRFYRVDNEFVKLAVRVSASGVFYARSLYVLNNNRTNRFIASGKLIQVY